MDTANPWFYCPGLHPGENGLEDEEARHAAAARRLGAGDAVTLFDGAGRLGAGTISALGRHAAAVTVPEVVVQEPPARALTVATALPKGKRWQFLVEKLTELGAAVITPVKFSRSVVTGSDPENAVRWAREACKQCRRARLPEITPEIPLEKFLAGARAETMLFLAAPGGEKLSRADCRAAAVIVGPEGGLTAAETAACLETGARALTLGPHILRVETAALAAAAVLGNW